MKQTAATAAAADNPFADIRVADRRRTRGGIARRLRPIDRRALRRLRSQVPILSACVQLCSAPLESDSHRQDCGQNLTQLHAPTCVATVATYFGFPVAAYRAVVAARPDCHAVALVSTSALNFPTTTDDLLDNVPPAETPLLTQSTLADIPAAANCQIVEIAFAASGVSSPLESNLSDIGGCGDQKARRFKRQSSRRRRALPRQRRRRLMSESLGLGGFSDTSEEERAASATSPTAPPADYDADDGAAAVNHCSASRDSAFYTCSPGPPAATPRKSGGGRLSRLCRRCVALTDRLRAVLTEAEAALLTTTGDHMQHPLSDSCRVSADTLICIDLQQQPTQQLQQAETRTQRQRRRQLFKPMIRRRRRSRPQADGDLQPLPD